MRGSDSTPDAAPAPVEKASYWEDFVDILYAPSQVFARRENGNFWIPLLVVTLFFAVLWFASTRVLGPVFDAEFDRQIQRMITERPNVSADDLEAGRAAARAIQLVGAMFIVPVVILLVGLALWLVGKVVEARQTLRSALVVAGFAYFPRVLEQAAAIAEGLFRDVHEIDGRNRLSWGVARFLDPDTVSPALLGVVSRIDLFTIWVTVLLAIGLSVTGRISGQRAAVAGVMMWLVGAIPTFFALLGG